MKADLVSLKVISIHIELGIVRKVIFSSSFLFFRFIVIKHKGKEI